MSDLGIPPPSEPVPLPYIRWGCPICNPSDEKLLAAQVVVSPEGIAHLGEENGDTVCGLDATGAGWWWPL